MKEANDGIEQQVALMRRIEAATLRLETRESERRVQYGRFEKRLRQLSEQDSQLRDVLLTVIPADLLHGLHPFAQGCAAESAR